MQDSDLRERNEKSKVPPQKPAIAAKPKYVPPVKLKSQPVPKRDVPQQQNPSRRATSRGATKETPRELLQSERNVEYTEKSYSVQSDAFQPYMAHPQVPQAFTPPDAFKNGTYVEYTTTYEGYTKYTEKCDKFTTDPIKSVDVPLSKAPNSPNTVCCSILSNASNDCCGIIANPNKKELNGKTITKIDSVDSNSSDSGGFKDFVQLDIAQKLKAEKAEQIRPLSHQRKISQTECVPQETRQSSAPPKQHYVPNAQALAQFLPQDQNAYKHFGLDRTDASNRPMSNVNVMQASQRFFEKVEERKPVQKARPQIISQTQFQQSTKKLEELLSHRYEKERVARKGQSCLLDGESSQDVEQKMLVQKQIQQKLQADLQQTVKQIQEIQSIELRLPQNRKWNEVGCVL